MIALSKKKWMTAAALVALVAVPLSAYALISTKNLDTETRSAIGQVFLPDFAIPSASEVTVGTNGVLGSNTAQGAAGSLDPSITTVRAIAYPTTICVLAVDTATNDTLACVSGIIVGRNQFGETIRETIGAVNETAPGTCTNQAFARVTSVALTDCGGGTEAGDVVRVTTSSVLGLPVRIRRDDDVDAACIIDASASNNMICPTNAVIVSSAAVNETYHTINMADSDFTAIADGDSVYLRVFNKNPTN